MLSALPEMKMMGEFDVLGGWEDYYYALIKYSQLDPCVHAAAVTAAAAAKFQVVAVANVSPGDE